MGSSGGSGGDDLRFLSRPAHCRQWNPAGGEGGCWCWCCSGSCLRFADLPAALRGASDTPRAPTSGVHDHDRQAGRARLRHRSLTSRWVSAVWLTGAWEQQQQQLPQQQPHDNLSNYSENKAISSPTVIVFAAAPRAKNSTALGLRAVSEQRHRR